MQRLSSQGFLCLILGIFPFYAACSSRNAEPEFSEPKENRVAVLLDETVPEVEAEAFNSLVDTIDEKGGALAVVPLCGAFIRSVHHGENTPLDEEFESVVDGRAWFVEYTKKRVSDLLDGQSADCRDDDPIFNSVFTLHTFGAEPFLKRRGSSIVILERAMAAVNKRFTCADRERFYGLENVNIYIVSQSTVTGFFACDGYIRASTFDEVRDHLEEGMPVLR